MIFANRKILIQGERKDLSEDVIGKLSEQRQEEETLAWLERINKGMKRMTQDEEYRKEIAKDLS